MTVQPGTPRPLRTTELNVLRLSASSNACRRSGLDASGVPTFVYGRWPSPFLSPMLKKTIPEVLKPGWEITRRLEVCLTLWSSFPATGPFWRSPASSAAVSAAELAENWKTILSKWTSYLS